MGRTIRPQRSGDGRVAAVDGIRGLAACYVVMHHVWQYSIASSTTDPPAWFRAASVFKYGSYAVAVFIVVSGYCLARPVISRLEDSHGPRWFGQFVSRRGRRLLPPYALALAASMLLIAAQPILRRPSGTPWDITLPNFTTGKVLSHLTLVHNWSRQWEYGYNPPFWSIALEVQIYIVFALLLLPLWRRRGLAVMLGAAAVMGLTATAINRGPSAPWMVVLFAFGVIVATRPAPIEDLGRRLADRRIRRVAATAAVVAVVVVSAATSGLPHHWAEMMRHLVIGVVCAVGIVVIDSDRAVERKPGRVAGMLGSRPATWLGVRSYSLYLTHYPLVAVVALHVADRTDLAVPPAFVLLTILTFPASLLLAAVFHRVAERPFLNPPRPAVAPPVDGTTGPTLSPV